MCVSNGLFKTTDTAEGILGRIDIYDWPTKLAVYTHPIPVTHASGCEAKRSFPLCEGRQKKSSKYVAKKPTVFTISSFSKKKKFVFVLNYKCKVEIKIVYFFKSVTKYVSIYPLIWLLPDSHTNTR